MFQAQLGGLHTAQNATPICAKNYIRRPTRVLYLVRLPSTSKVPTAWPHDRDGISSHALVPSRYRADKVETALAKEATQPDTNSHRSDLRRSACKARVFFRKQASPAIISRPRVPWPPYYLLRSIWASSLPGCAATPVSDRTLEAYRVHLSSFPRNHRPPVPQRACVASSLSLSSPFALPSSFVLAVACAVGQPYGLLDGSGAPPCRFQRGGLRRSSYVPSVWVGDGYASAKHPTEVRISAPCGGAPLTGVIVTGTRAQAKAARGGGDARTQHLIRATLARIHPTVKTQAYVRPRTRDPSRAKFLTPVLRPAGLLAGIGRRLRPPSWLWHSVA